VKAKAKKKRNVGRRTSDFGKKPKTKRPKSEVRSPKPEVRGPRSGPTWLAFVKTHGLVLASARGPVPSLAEAVAGEPIVGSWWAHPKGRAIFAALSQLDESDDVRSFRLIAGKITLVHRRLWPALVKLARDGVLAPERVAAIQQEHMATGEHRNRVVPFPDWVDDATASVAGELTVARARALLGRAV
jgi:hypothetical protein